MIRAGEREVLDIKLGTRQVNEVRRGEEMVWRGEEETGTRLTVELGADDLSQTLSFTQSAAGAVTVKWGDGSPSQTSENTEVTLTHTYGSLGRYVITLQTAEGESWRLPYASSGSNILGGNSENPDTVLRHVVYDGAGNPDGSATVLPTGAFRDCTGLQSFATAGAEKLPDHICRNSPELQTISLDGVTKIGVGSFANCTGLSTVSIPGSVTTSSHGAFLGCTGLQSVTLPDNGYDLGYHASGSMFNGCTGLTEITIPEGWTTLASGSMFSGCTGLEQVTLPSSLLEISNGTFRNTTALTEITIPDSVETIAQEAFYGSGLTHVEVSAEYVGPSAFGACPDLTAIWLRASVLEICSHGTSILQEGSMVYCQNGEQPNEGLIIYCEADSKPSGWHSLWNYLTSSVRATVVWGQKTRPW